MTRKARIAAAIAAPLIGSLATVALVAAPAAPAGAAGPVSVSGSGIHIDIPPLLLVNIPL